MSASTTENLQAFTPLSDRIRRFRDKSRARGAAPPLSPKVDNFGHAFFELYPDCAHWERYARAIDKRVA